MDTKLNTLKNAAHAGDWQKAVAIAAKFPRLGEARNAVLDAHTAYTNPRWSAGLGHDVEELKRLGKAALVRRFEIEAVV